MMSDNNHNPLREKVQEARNHFPSNSYSNNDLSVILESFKDDDDFLEFYGASPNNAPLYSP